MMKKLVTFVALIGILIAAGPAAAEKDPERWGDYLDYAYVYSSADPDALKKRLAEYGREAGVTLEQYVTNFIGDPGADVQILDETEMRRKAIAELLQYLATRDPAMIEAANATASSLALDSDAFESRYWYYYIRAHRALERGNAPDFVNHCLRLWMKVIVPLEAPFDTLEALSLSQSPNTGFVSALPYVFENISRMILLRSQEMGLKDDLDPLGAIVRMLADGRVGAHPEIIPAEASSRAYLDRIVARLDGAESDSGSLTFTLLLFEAGKYHDQARSLLASEGFSEETVEAIDVASGAYLRAFGYSRTAQGRAAVSSRVLREIGEINAAKQRLDVDPFIKLPFTIDEAIEVYDEHHAARTDQGWMEIGYRRVGREAYLETMRRLWEEIQEASLNSADYYLARSISSAANKDEYVRSAAMTYTRYLAFFEKYLGEDASDVIPDSAYFAAYEASKGYADAFMNFASRSATAAEMEGVTARYLQALQIYPFDPRLWPALTRSLERIGRSGEYLSMARPIANEVAQSRHVNSWIHSRKPGHQEIEVLRRALSNDLVLMYLGFAADSGMDELNASLQKLRKELSKAEAKLAWLKGAASPLEGIAGSPGPASPAPLLSSNDARPINMTREIARTRVQLDVLRRKVKARARALPLYNAAVEAEGLIAELRSQRDNPVHTLLRRMYHENRS